MFLSKPWFSLLLILPISLMSIPTAIAQSIRSSDNDTRVHHHNNRYDINGGMRSSDGTNLFHSFERLGLTSSEIANFQSQPDIQNILVRVVGGNPSVIDGLLQVTGGSSNLFLMNPAGVVFGQNARLDLPAAFTATTASGIGLEGGWFNAIGTPDYGALVGQPTTYAFGLGAGTITNAADLRLEAGQRLALLGGSINNSGHITVPSGQIVLTAVPGSSLIRLSQPQSPLSVEIERSAVGETTNLPTLLTGGQLDSATQMAIAPNGAVHLASAATLTAAGHLDVSPAGAIGNGGEVILQSGRTHFTGDITARGGTQQGNGGFVEVSGDTLRFEGQVDTSAANGNWGTLLLDPRDIYITYNPNVGNDPLDTRLNPLTLMSQRSNIIVEATNNLTITTGVSLNFAYNLVPVNGSTGGDITFTADADRTGGGNFIMEAGSSIFTNGRRLSITAANISAQNLNTYSIVSGSRAGDVSLIANGDDSADSRGKISVGAINAAQYSLGQGDEAGNVTIRSESAIPGSISVESIDTRSIYNTGNGGDVTLSGNLVQVRGLVFGTLDGIVSSGLEPGQVSIRHAGGRLNLPFVVNGLVGEENGTLGRINTGSSGRIDGNNRRFEMTAETTTVQPVPGVSITSVNQAPAIAPADSITLTPPANSTSVAVTLPQLTATDSNGDATGFIIADLPTGASLTRNGVAIANGTAVATGDNLIYTPPAGQAEALAFRVVAIDRTSRGDILSQSANAYQIRFAPLVNNPIPSLPVEDGAGNGGENGAGSRTGEAPRQETGGNLGTPEQDASQEFDFYLGLDRTPIKTTDEAQSITQGIEQATGSKPALLYVDFTPDAMSVINGVLTPPEEDQLELTLVSAQGQIRRRLAVTRSQFFAVADEFRTQVTDPRFTRNQRYLPAAQQLYQWLIAPLTEELQAQQISNIAFIPDAGLRSLPYAALHDGQGFLIEKYSIGLMPSLSLTDTRYTNIQRSQILALGISESTQGEMPLPAVSAEIATLMSLWRDRGSAFLNSNATLENLQRSRQRRAYGIIHMATHANFTPGTLDKSYIQLWNQKLQFDQLRQLGWNDPPVEMLVLSACRTALGDTQSELGFAGLAVQAGVKTVVASLWSVDDTATTALMTEFYQQLNTAPLKAEALRQAQIEMIQGEMAHPYYWAAFTMVGNPW
jgi:filamentous hemagglutinin family protein